MHDFLAAKDIINEVLSSAKKNNLKVINKVLIELGNKKYEHGEHAHIEMINQKNLEFNLKLIAKNTAAEKANFIIKKSDIPDIIVREIEGE